MREVLYSARFKRAMKRFKNSPRQQDKILEVIGILQTQNPPLPAKLREHVLQGNFAGMLECHVLPDLLIIYTRTDDTLSLIAAGSHSEPFG